MNQQSSDWSQRGRRHYDRSEEHEGEISISDVLRRRDRRDCRDDESFEKPYRDVYSFEKPYRDDDYWENDGDSDGRRE